MTATARDRGATGSTATMLAWSATSLGAAAWATSGPVLRPGVTVEASTFAIGMAIAAAVGWPLVTRDRVTATFVAMQGSVMLAWVAATAEASPRAIVASLAGWLTWIAAGTAGRAAADRHGIPVATLWAVLLAGTAAVVLGRGGG